MTENETKKYVWLDSVNGYIAKENLVRKIASYIYCDASVATNSGDLSVFVEDIADYFGVGIETIRELSKEIEDCLRTDFKEQVAEVVYIEDNLVGAIYFDITLYDAYIQHFSTWDACVIDVIEDD